MAIVGLLHLSVPAIIYLVFSLAIIIVSSAQRVHELNTKTTPIYTPNDFVDYRKFMPYYSPIEYDMWAVFAVKILYIVFWTWIINILWFLENYGLAITFVFIPFFIWSMMVNFLELPNI